MVSLEPNNQVVIKNLNFSDEKDLSGSKPRDAPDFGQEVQEPKYMEGTFGNDVKSSNQISDIRQSYDINVMQSAQSIQFDLTEQNIQFPQI